MVKSKNEAVPQVRADAREVPVADVALLSRTAKRATWLRRAVWSSVVLAPILLLSLLVVLGRPSQAAKSVSTPTASSSQGRSAATLACSAGWRARRCRFPGVSLWRGSSGGWR